MSAADENLNSPSLTEAWVPGACRKCVMVGKIKATQEGVDLYGKGYTHRLHCHSRRSCCLRRERERERSDGPVNLISVLADVTTASFLRC